ncbi:hypothetical protein E2C01_095352 [Portunus trituberculatus]|uniref:Uncharacterized protein n=1 Tax=Portunus trituberculatus TaxID=210409 RepID=A0A5B7JZY6_PORTR|nr:hypothetical protein [Portunus trituberculatus]
MRYHVDARLFVSVFPDNIASGRRSHHRSRDVKTQESVNKFLQSSH